MDIVTKYDRNRKSQANPIYFLHLPLIGPPQEVICADAEEVRQEYQAIKVGTTRGILIALIAPQL